MLLIKCQKRGLKVPQIIYRRKPGVGDDKHALSRCSFRMHNNLRKWEKKKPELSRKERTLLHSTQQISKFLQGKTSNLKDVNTSLLSPNCYLCSGTSWICVCACIISFSPLMSSLKLCKNFDFSLCTIFMGEDLDIIVKVCDKFVKGRNADIRQWCSTSENLASSPLLPLHSPLKKACRLTAEKQSSVSLRRTFLVI